jgi:hypothetical protein
MRRCTDRLMTRSASARRHQCCGHRNAERIGLQLSVLRFAQIKRSQVALGARPARALAIVSQRVKAKGYYPL